MLRSKFYASRGLSSSDPQIPLDQPGKWWVTSAHKLHSLPTVSYPSIKLPGRDGELSVPSSRIVGAATWEISIAVEGSTYETYLNNKSELESLFNPVRKLMSVREMFYDAAGTKVRTIAADGMCVGMSVESEWKDNNYGCEMQIKFHIPMGMWLQAPIITAPVTPAVGLKTATDLAGGSAPQYACSFGFTPTSTTASIKINASGSTWDDPSAYLDFVGDGTLGTTQPVFINVSMLRVTQGGRNLSHMLTTGNTPMYITTAGTFTVSRSVGIGDLTAYSYLSYY